MTPGIYIKFDPKGERWTVTQVSISIAPALHASLNPSHDETVLAEAPDFASAMRGAAEKLGRPISLQLS